MDVTFFVDIEAPDGTRYGSGPLSNVISWSNVCKLSRSGNFRFEMPMTQPDAGLIVERRVARCRAITAAGPIQIGAGIIDNIGYVPSSDGNIKMIVSGSDLMRELNFRNTFTNSADNVTHAASLAQLEALAPSGWSFNADDQPPINSIYHQYDGETVLNGSIKMAELSGTQFYLVGDRTLQYSSNWMDSGLRAIEIPTQPDISDPNVFYIRDISYADDSYNLISRIYPYGDRGSVTLADCTRTPPAGFTLDAANNYIVNTAIESSYGRVERVEAYPEVKRIGAAPADDIAASNALYDLALAELQRSNLVRRDFALSLIAGPRLIRPMEQIRCVFRRLAHGQLIENIDSVLSVIETETKVDQYGLRTTRLLVGTIGHPPPNEHQTLIDLKRQLDGIL